MVWRQAWACQAPVRVSRLCAPSESACYHCSKGPCEDAHMGTLRLSIQYFRWICIHFRQCYSRPMKTCDKCRGAMLPERAVDLDAGLAITVFACLNCGRRKAADSEPRPLTARH
jgi:hypothetical protein